MAYRLSLRDGVADSVRECARDQLGRAAERLERDRATDPVGAVHGARKNLKKTRALLRLVRSDLGDRTYRHENRALAGAGRALAGARDADVMVVAADGLAARFGDELSGAAFAELRRVLAADAVAERAAGDAAGDTVAAVLREAAGRVGDWPLDRCDTSTLTRGAATAYRRGRKNLARADRHPSSERRHEWRKRVKDLCYHHRLLEEAWPDVMRAYASDLRALSERLGDEHDLALLAGRLQAPDGPPVGSVVELAPVIALAGERREELLAEARRLASRLYAERPGAFEDRIGRYLDPGRRR